MTISTLEAGDSGCALEFGTVATPTDQNSVGAIGKQNETTLFTNEFLRVDINQIVNDLSDKGYYAFPSAISRDTVNAIQQDATRTRINLNRNIISGVYADKQYYLTNLLAVSQAFYRFATSSFVFKVCREYLGSSFRLKALRYYETFGGHHMQWHTDNKTDRGFADIPGIIFIFYVSDVEDGEFQYIEGSHLWSGQKAYSDYSDEFIEKNYQNKIQSFKMPSGSLIIYNTYGIHRAKPVKNKDFVRKSVFFQVDSEIDNSEPIIINTEFITETNSQIAMFLGFGKAARYEVFPNTDLNALPLGKTMVSVLVKYALYRSLHASLHAVLSGIPRPVKSAIKAMIRRW